MSASGDGTRGSPKSKGKTLRSFFGSLPGFSSAWNPVSHTKCSTKDVQTAVDPSGTPVPPSPVATNPQMARDASGLLQLSEQTAGDKNMGSIGATSSQDAFYSGVAGIMDAAKGKVQGSLSATQLALVGTKETVSGGVMGAVDMAKGLVKGGLDTSKSVLMGTKDTVTTGLTGAVNVVKGVAQGGLDTSKSVLMGPKNTVCAGAPGAINVVKGAAQGGLDTSNSAFPGTKSAMLAGFAGAMDMARGTAQTGLHPSKHILTGTEDMVCAGVTSIMDTAKDSQKNMDTTRDRLSTMLAHSAIRSMEECGHPAATHFATLPDELKGLGDFFQPMTAEEQAQLAASESGSRVLSANRGSYYICLGDLAPSFRQRAFEHALSHIQHNQFQARAALAQLQEAFQMIPTEFGKDRDIVGCKVADSWGKSMMRASVAQDRLCALVHQLHAAYSSLATSLQGLPEVQQQAGQARHSLCKLYGLVTSEAGSELQTEQLAQSSAGVVQAWQGLEVLLDKLQQNPPLDWLVGPFTLMPCGQLQAPEGWVGGVPRDHAMTTDDCTSPKLWIEQDQRVLRK